MLLRIAIGALVGGGLGFGLSLVSRCTGGG
jgi:hypothetical protein